MPRQPIAGNRLAGVDGEGAALQPPSSQSTSSADSARARTARASARNSAPAAVNSMPRPTRLKSFAPCRALQRRDRGTDRRLRNVERLGGARDVVAFRDHHEDTELFKRHGHDAISVRSRLAKRGRLRSARLWSASISEAGSPDSRRSPGRPSHRLAPCTYSASFRPRPARWRAACEAGSESCRRNGKTDSCC